jgi:NodT family efflux transporter outer membrane factor (OMF) lipoprotein
MPLCRLVLAASAAICVSACAVGPDFAAPEAKVPPAFEFWKPARTAQPAADPDLAARLVTWWKTLRDAELNSLVECAVFANPDIETALDRIQRAREHEIVVLGAALPTLGAAAGAGKGSGTDSVKPPRIPDSLDAAVNTTGFKEITGIAGFDAAWEVDLFGKYRRELEAAQYDTQAAINARSAVVISVIAEVARNYAILRGLQARIAIVRQNIDSAEKVLNLTLTRYNQGLTNEGDILLARREVEALNAALPALNIGVFEAESHIALLLGTFSGNVIGELKETRKLPQTPERLRPGRPVDLLRRRPDIRRAESEIASANARIGVATADLFPRLVVNAGVGVQGGRESAGSSPPVRGLIWSVGPGAYWPLLDFGRLDAAVDEAEYRTHELLVEYRKTVIAAVEDVNSALIRYSSDQEAVQHLAKAVDASRRALEFNTGRYQQGIGDFLNVLDAARQEYALQEQLVSAQQAVLLAYIALYKALGGGWELYQDIPPIPAPEPAVIASIRRLSMPTH